MEVKTAHAEEIECPYCRGTGAMTCVSTNKPQLWIFQACLTCGGTGRTVYVFQGESAVINKWLYLLAP